MEENPATLDPARCTDIDSFYITSQLYDTPYEYHYLKRPLQLVPSMARDLPRFGRLRRNGRTLWTMSFVLKSGLRYQDDPCFAGGQGRNVSVADLIFSIKRAADDSLEPFGKALLQGKLLGFDDFSKNLAEANQSGDPTKRRAAYAEDIAGVETIGEDGLRLLFVQPPQESLYFFANVTGAPVPAECVAYYDGEERAPFSRHPVASGPFLLEEWKDQSRLVLRRNPNYRSDDFYPTEGESADRESGLLDRAGRRLPMLDRIVVSIIKRGPPKWTLFGQGYLDLYRNKLDLQERLLLTPQLLERYRDRGVRRFDQIEFATFGWQFNLRHPLFANNLPLRQAISLIIDRDDLLRRFYFERAVPAKSVLPPGIEGYDPQSENPWAKRDRERARRLLIRAGYPGGRDPATGRALEIPMFDRAAQGRAPIYSYYTARFAELGLKLNIELLDFPSLIQKWNRREFVMMHWGWGADYPDPQNFLQLFYSPNQNNTYNTTSYARPEFDVAYLRLAQSTDRSERAAAIQTMLQLLQEDAPVVLLFHRNSHQYVQPWTAPVKPNPLEFREMKYWDLDPERREQLVTQWNRTGPLQWLLLIGAGLLLGALVWRSIAIFRRRAARS